MQRTIVGLLVTGAIALGGAVPAEGAAGLIGPTPRVVQPCNLKAIEHTAEHLMRAGDPGRVRMLMARYERLRSRCFVVPPHD